MRRRKARIDPVPNCDRSPEEVDYEALLEIAYFEDWDENDEYCRILVERDKKEYQKEWEEYVSEFN